MRPLIFKLTFITVHLLVFSIAFSQNNTKKILFLGNSYTYVNDLPQMLQNAANSTGDSIIFDSNTPGGYTLQGHYNNATSLSKIAMGKWDFVVLQDQSQLPSFPDADVENSVYPFAKKLDSLINLKNPCAETIFYMTWGRKNGDASNCVFWPPVCTYSGMDSLLNLRYRIMADSNNAILSPVGAVWNFIRKNYSNIELYSSDESHPSVAGTFAAACSFYTVIFRKDPTKILFNGNLNATDANKIKLAAKTVVFDNLLTWHVGEYDAKANFDFVDSSKGKIIFNNLSLNANNYLWSFGNGSISTLKNPTYTYSNSGNYNVKLIANKCSNKDSVSKTISVVVPDITPPNVNDKQADIYPNPATNEINIKLLNTFLVGQEYKMISIHGQIVLQGVLKSVDNTIKLNFIPSGIYLLKFGNSNTNVYKIIKQ